MAIFSAGADTIDTGYTDIPPQRWMACLSLAELEWISLSSERGYGEVISTESLRFDASLAQTEVGGIHRFKSSSRNDLDFPGSHVVDGRPHGGALRDVAKNVSSIRHQDVPMFPLKYAEGKVVPPASAQQSRVVVMEDKIGRYLETETVVQHVHIVVDKLKNSRLAGSVGNEEVERHFIHSYVVLSDQ